LTPTTGLGPVHAALAGTLPLDSISGEALRLVETFHASELGKRAAAENAVREQHLTFAIGGHQLRGQIDLWFEQDGRSALVDYKTDQVSPEEAPERLRTYGLQLQLYSLALEQANGTRPAQATAYFLRPDLALDVDLSPPALDRAREAVRRFFAAQAKIDFPLHIGEHCFRCPHYGGLCPAKVPHHVEEQEDISAIRAGQPAPAEPASPVPAKPARQTSGTGQQPAAGQLSLPVHQDDN
jgi:hypothetical protein